MWLKKCCMNWQRWKENLKLPSDILFSFVILVICVNLAYLIVLVPKVSAAIQESRETMLAPAMIDENACITQRDFCTDGVIAIRNALKKKDINTANKIIEDILRVTGAEVESAK